MNSPTTIARMSAEGRATIKLPWPNRVLHPNERKHWAVKAKAAKKARQDGAAAAQIAGVRHIEADGLIVRVTAFPPNKHARDDDGIMTNLKSYFDGIADVVGIDDSKWRMGEMERGEPVKHGAVHVEVEIVK